METIEAATRPTITQRIKNFGVPKTIRTSDLSL